ncbi:hypothetical protein MCOR25_004829 [Pyricularia grisea]|uniref:DNA-directed RNA polymerase n=1 Tax=Pyricularia grisea TaxID=148305 RepID=A0A6P8B2Q3_PYRGI|nr:uncharacterized protein PgNI_07347 [Pyricularia grisea]KAI6367753.1 hypothetical protein MCOR25_004829 [Pyricularia grisea]TLD09190.1 hypothetical protein PgNI_07347 [Pyricularia grisea]
MLSRSRPCQRSLALRQLAARKLPRSQVTSFRSASAKPPSLAATTTEAQQQWRTGGAHECSSRTRGFATAVDDMRFDGAPKSHYSMPPPSVRPTNALYQTQPLAGANVLRLPEIMAPNMPKLYQKGTIPGDLAEMFAVLDACLTIGKLDRAGVVLRRLSSPQLSMIDRTDLMALHNMYLHVAVEQLAASPSEAKAEHIQQWYETEIRKAELPQTPETIAYVLKAALLGAPNEEDWRLRRTVTRYMAMAEGDAGLEVLYMTDILTDKDRAFITKVCPTYNITIEEAKSDMPPEPSSIETEDIKTPDPINLAFPEVLPTPQKGTGLKTVKRTLSLFGEIPQGYRIRDLPLPQQREIQMRLERDTVDAALDKWREDNQALNKMGLNTSINSSVLNARLYDWQVALEARLKEYMVEAENDDGTAKVVKDEAERALVRPFMRQSTASRLAAITILSVMSSLAIHGADKGVPILQTITGLARSAEEDVIAFQRNLRQKREKSLRKIKFARAEGAKALPGSNSTDPTLRIEDIYNVNPEAPERWPTQIRLSLASVLLGALVDIAAITVTKEHPQTKKKISAEQPAFMRSVQFRKGKKSGILVPHKELVQLMLREPRKEFLARHLPMVCEPEPWTRIEKGGYLEQPTGLVRIKRGEKDQKIYAEAAMARGDMEQVAKGLDALGRVGWRINKPVLDVILQVWNSGEGIGGIPPLSVNIEVPEEPLPSEDPLVRVKWIRELKRVENLKASYHSQRCFTNFQLEIARAYRDQTMYFPHNVDFRGRAYPIPIYLNHMGADLCRSMLLFDKGKPLGEDGIHWLKVHLANVYGFDKASLSERAQFAVDHMEDIVDSATNPLSGKRWWLDAEDPWQCLATCKELKAAFDLPDPTQYECHLPVHQDGTCNGLQHYAALGGDSWGARQVNLEPGDRPADVYSAVADLVIKSVEEDMANGSEYAAALQGKIKRKVVKQTVMTNVYGVTFMGAKAQVKKQLDALYPNIKEETGIDPMYLASYVAAKIFKAMSTMFKGAHDIQYWLGEIGSRVCRALTPDQMSRLSEEMMRSSKQKEKAAKTLGTTGNPEYDEVLTTYNKASSSELLSQFRSTIIWTTPLRMPVVQPYRKDGRKIIKTNFQELILKNTEPWDPVHKQKQLQAFPPNFVHSLDASHMMLSALECDANGLTFAAVHDSFWTHPCDIQKMSNILRDAFVRIHEEDVIGRLADEFKARYKGSLTLVKVDVSSDAAQAIVAWRKKYPKITFSDEMFLEKRRLELLASEEAAEREKGKALETPASIYERLSKGSEELVDAEDVPTPLSAIPKTAQQLVDGKKAVKDDAVLGEQESMQDQELDEEFDCEEAEDAEEAEEAADDNIDAPAEDLSGTEKRESTGTSVPNKSFASTIAATKPKTVTAPRKKIISIWAPMSFPDIPQKGDFDVTRLKSSKYFFS